MATHSSVLAWRIPRTAEPGGLPSLGSHRVRHDWSDLAAAAADLLNSLAFSVIQQMLEIWSLVPFVNPAWTSRSSWFTYCWSLTWRIFEHYFAIVWDEYTCAVVWIFFGIVFLWDLNENWPFPVLWPLLSFPNLLNLHIEYSTFAASSFSIWNSSTGIPSSLLALFLLMLPKDHETSHS